MAIMACDRHSDSLVTHTKQSERFHRHSVSRRGRTLISQRERIVGATKMSMTQKLKARPVGPSRREPPAADYGDEVSDAALLALKNLVSKKSGKTMKKLEIINGPAW